MLVSRFFQWLSGRQLGRAMCCLRRGSLSCLLVCQKLLNTTTMLVRILDTMFCLAWQFSRPSCMSSCGIMFADAWGLNTHVVPSVTHHYQVHDMTNAALLVVIDTKRFASPFSGDLLRWTDRLYRAD